MALFKCKMCGGDLVLTEGNPIAQCEYCGSVQTVPSADNEKKLTLFGRANRLRLGCEFDKAAGVYEALVADFPEEAEAYWGLVLCKFGIEYVDDPATGKKVPTCHRSSFQSVMEDSNFEQVLENSDAVARKIYREEAKQIEELRKGILEISSKADPYDIFICYKETGENGQRTIDSVLAQDIYDALTEKGYRVFFARISLEDKLGQEYEPYIFTALNSAKVMLAIGTDYEHFNAVWVRNEWSRYLNLMVEDHEKHLIPCYKGIDAYDMPKEFAKLQAQDLGKVGAVQDLLRGIDKLIATPAAPAPVQAGADIAQLLTMGNEALEQGDWDVASNRFDLALLADPTCADAHLGKLMAERKCKERKDLAKQKKRLESSGSYREAVNYADEALKQELEEYSKKTKSRFVRQMICIASAAALCVVAIAVGLLSYQRQLQKEYDQIVDNFLAGKIGAQAAYNQLDKINGLVEKDEDILYLVALGIGDNVALNKYSCESLRMPFDMIGLLGKDARSVKTLEVTSGLTSVEKDAFSALTNLSTLILPKGVKNIGESAFAGNTKLQSITLPNSVTSIGDSAFKGCTSLISITIPDSVTNIGNYAFESCTGLTELAIPQSVTSIGNQAFGKCAGLKSVTIPQSITSIGSYVFAECTDLTEISINSIGNGMFAGCTGLQSVEIPTGVTKIGDRVFQACTNLQNVAIPQGVISIGFYAFGKCANLQSITIPEGVEKFENYAFAECTSLTSITIPDSVTNIGNSTFIGCTSLTSITIPDSVTRIGISVFPDGLKDVYYTGTEEQWSQMEVNAGNKGLLNAQIHYNYQG